MRLRRSLRWIAILAFACVVAWLAMSFAVAWRITSREQPRRVERLPEQLTGRAEELRLRTRDDEDVGAWYLEAVAADAPSVLLLHGKGSARASRLGAAAIFRERGCAALLITLRGHGDSSGERQDFGWSARADVVAAVGWLEARRPGRPIFISGTSLGAAAAVFAAGELGERVRGYELECLYRDLDTAARNRCDLTLPSPLDWIAFEGLRLASDVLLPDHARISPFEAIATVPRSIPVLLLAGGADRHATPAESQALFERIREHAELVVIDAAAHDRLQSANPTAYREALLGWFDRALTR